jgi:dihydroneopterin aldolase
VRIELAGIEVHGFHGVLAEERKTGQRFLFDVELDYVDGRAAETDDVADAIDYRDVVQTVREISDGHAHHLLEALATAVADALVARFPATRVRVRVRKPDVRLALPVEHAAVVVERRRTN